MVTWREADATALEAHVAAIEQWLEHTDDLVEQANHLRDEQVAQVLRSACGLLRERRNGLNDRARELRVST